MTESKKADFKKTLKVIVAVVERQLSKYPPKEGIRNER